MAKRKVMILFFMPIPPIANCFYRTIMSTLPTNNTIMQAYFGLILMNLNGLHWASTHTFFTADALTFIHLHSINKGELAAEIMH